MVRYHLLLLIKKWTGFKMNEELVRKVLLESAEKWRSDYKKMNGFFPDNAYEKRPDAGISKAVGYKTASSRGIVEYVLHL